LFGLRKGTPKQARACVRENFVASAKASNEAPPDQSCPSELVQLGPLPLGGPKMLSGKVLDLAKKAAALRECHALRRRKAFFAHFFVAA